MSRAFVLCFLISACASQPATSPPKISPVVARPVETPRPVSVHFEPISSGLSQYVRFDRIAKRHKMAVKSFEHEATDLAAPTDSMECEMIRLQCASATMNVLLTNGAAVSAAAYVGLHFNGLNLGQRIDPVDSSLDTYEKAVDTLLDRMSYARELYKSFAACAKGPPNAIPQGAPSTL